MSVRFVIGSLVWTFVLAIAGLSVFVVEKDFDRLSHQAHEWERRIAEHHRVIRLLRAEQSYLLRPDRLEYLARKHLSLLPSDPLRRLDSRRFYDAQVYNDNGHDAPVHDGPIHDAQVHDAQVHGDHVGASGHAFGIGKNHEAGG